MEPGSATATATAVAVGAGAILVAQGVVAVGQVAVEHLKEEYEKIDVAKARDTDDFRENLRID